ncbi:MAG: PASTA domain-containing protein [Planctomycetaceae bacterium]
MVRFIAAITVVTVCCYSSAVQAQSKPPAKRPVAPVSRTQQADDPPARPKIELKNEHLNQNPKPLTPELEQLLRDWAAASEKIERLEGEHLRRVYDMTYEVEKLSQGRFYFETPDKGRINITPVEITDKMLDQRANGEVPTKKRKDSKPFELKSDQEECWSCDGLRVYEMDVAQKQARVAQLPADMQGKNIMDSPLPFLFGMPPEKAKRRFAMSLMRPIVPASGRAYLHIEPRLPQDAGNWASADVILNLKTFLPDAVQLVDPAGTKITVYSFSNLKVNENKFLDSLFDKQDPKTRFTPDLRGFNVNVQDGGEPAPVAENDPANPKTQSNSQPAAPPKAAKPVLVNVQGMSHSDAVIQLERQGLKRVKENPEVNNIILEAGPAAEKEEDVFTVQSQDPPAGTPLKKGMKVRLTIWTKSDGNAKQ